MSQVLSEHLEYLLLPGRLGLFRKAIDLSLLPGESVADLGCGVGVLGLLCLEAGAAHVWGIDQTDAIHLARESVSRAGFGDRYKSISGSTFRTDLPEQVDLIICDHVGFLGFDYGIVSLMRDARRRFLKPGGKMIPQSLDLFVAAVSSDECNAKAGAWAGHPVPSHYHWMQELGRNVRYPHEFEIEELVSAPAALGHVSFADDTTELFRFETVIRIEQAARFDGLAGWFDCQLAGPVRMTNSPIAPDSIRRAQAFLPVNESFMVEPGDEISVSLRFRADDSFIAWSVTPPRGGPRQLMTTLNSVILDPSNLQQNAGRPLALTAMGEARAFVLAQVDGERTSDEILARVLAQKPDLLPTETAIREFVRDVLAHDCTIRSADD